MSAADCCSGPSRNTVLPPSVPSSLHASSSIWIATASRCAMWSGRPTTAASSKAIFLRPSATASTCASRRPRTPTRAMSKPCIASKKTSSSTSKISEAAAISLPRSTPISFTSTWCDPTPTRKIKVPGKSSSGLLLAHPSNSACFHPSSWITTSTTQGDTMSLGFPNACSRLRNQRDLADAAFDLQTDGRRSFAVGLVRVLVIVVAQPVRVHRANSAGNVHHNADFAGQANRRLAHPAFQVGHEIGFAIAGEIEIHLSGAHAHIQPRHRHIAQSQMAAPRAHLHFQLQRHVVAEAQVPVVMRRAEMCALVILRNRKMSDAVGDLVLDARRFIGAAVVEIGDQQVTRAAANVDLARGHLQ